MDKDKDKLSSWKSVSCIRLFAIKYSAFFIFANLFNLSFKIGYEKVIEEVGPNAGLLFAILGKLTLILEYIFNK